MPRYAVVTSEARLRPPTGELVVVERLPGSASTEFGVPGAIPERDSERLTKPQLRRAVGLVRAAWTIFDRVVAGAPPELRKGPRGGGRDRDKIVDHVSGGEVGYANSMRVKLRQPARGDRAAIEAFREAIVGALEQPAAEARWPVRYAARRIAWHALDHAWEIEDRAEA